MGARWFAFIVWARAAAAGVFWGLKVFVRPAAAPPHAVVAVNALPQADVARVLGVPSTAEEDGEMDAVAAAPGDGRFVLVGVVAARGAPSARDGLALIAVDGKPPRAYRVGAIVDGDQVVQSVEQRAVQLGPRGGPARIALELPVRPPPATGVPGAVTMPPASPMPPGGMLPPATGLRPMPVRPGMAMPPQAPAPGNEDDTDDVDATEPSGGGGGPGTVAR
jgi:general secretion pathway protein C